MHKIASEYIDTYIYIYIIYIYIVGQAGIYITVLSTMRLFMVIYCYWSTLITYSRCKIMQGHSRGHLHSPSYKDDG